MRAERGRQRVGSWEKWMIVNSSPRLSVYVHTCSDCNLIYFVVCIFHYEFDLKRTATHQNPPGILTRKPKKICVYITAEKEHTRWKKIFFFFFFFFLVFSNRFGEVIRRNDQGERSCFDIYRQTNKQTGRKANWQVDRWTGCADCHRRNHFDDHPYNSSLPCNTTRTRTQIQTYPDQKPCSHWRTMSVSWTKRSEEQTPPFERLLATRIVWWWWNGSWSKSKNTLSIMPRYRRSDVC